MHSVKAMISHVADQVSQVFGVLALGLTFSFVFVLIFCYGQLGRALKCLKFSDFFQWDVNGRWLFY